MGLGKSQNNQKFLKVVYENNDKDNGTPSFGLSEKVGGEWKVTATYDYVEGELVGIEMDSYEYRGNTQNQYKLKISDEGVVYSVELGYTYYSRSVLNSLSGTKDFGGKTLKLSLYRNKDGFVSIFVELDGEKTDWELKPGELPKQGDAKWLDSFDYFIGKIKEAIPAQQSGIGGGDFIDAHVEFATEQEGKTNEKTVGAPAGGDVSLPGEEDDGLPF